MGLDAVVYCECYERGRLRVPPPRPDLVFIDEDGAPTIKAGDDTELETEFDGWLWSSQACEHKSFILLHHRLGNAGEVGLIRSVTDRIVASISSPLPIIQKKVIYSGIHGGDRISIEDVPELKDEIDRLCSVLPMNLSEMERYYMQRFCTQMNELIAAALSVNKPIVF